MWREHQETLREFIWERQQVLNQWMDFDISSSPIEGGGVCPVCGQSPCACGTNDQSLDFSMPGPGQAMDMDQGRQCQVPWAMTWDVIDDDDMVMDDQMMMAFMNEDGHVIGVYEPESKKALADYEDEDDDEIEEGVRIPKEKGKYFKITKRKL